MENQGKVIQDLSRLFKKSGNPVICTKTHTQVSWVMGLTLNHSTIM